MRQLADIKGAEAIDVTADLVELISKVFGSDEIKKMRKEHSDLAQIFSYVLKNNRHDVIQMLAVLDGCAPDEYLDKTSMATLLHDVDTMLGDPTVRELFTLQSRTDGNAVSGSVMDNTQEQA